MNHKMKKKAKDFTFVLGHPLVFLRRTVGDVLEEFTNLGLNVVDLRCMSVTEKFLSQSHLEDVFVSNFITEGPFLAVKLEGDNAVQKARQLVSKKKDHPFWDHRQLVYSSASVLIAQRECAMWFRADSPNWKQEALEGKNLMFALPEPEGKCGGPSELVLKALANSIEVDFRLERANTMFILIKQKAFQKRKMPKLLSTIMRNALLVRGLKLVKTAEIFGIALIVTPPNIQLDEKGSLPLGEYDAKSDLVYVSEKGEWLDFAKEFFPFGVVGWLDPAKGVHCGSFFEATLTGLVF